MLLEGQGAASLRQHRTRVALRVWMGCLSPQFRQRLHLHPEGPKGPMAPRPLRGWAGRGGTLASSSKAGPAAFCLGTPFRWRGPLGSPAPRSLVTSGRGRPRQGGTQPEDRQAALSLPAPREVMGWGRPKERGSEKEMEAGRRQAGDDHSRSSGHLSPSKNRYPDHSLAPNCSLIGPREGVEELAVALQAAAERGGFKSTI